MSLTVKKCQCKNITSDVIAYLYFRHAKEDHSRVSVFAAGDDDDDNDDDDDVLNCKHGRPHCPQHHFLRLMMRRYVETTNY